VRQPILMKANHRLKPVKDTPSRPLSEADLDA